MLGTHEYTCRSCGFKHDEGDVVEKSFCLGLHPFPRDDPKTYREWEREHLRWLKANTRTYICNPCWLRLTMPLIISAVDWEIWKRSSTEGYHTFTDYPFLVGLVARIDNFLRKNPGVPIDVGPVLCPYCGITMSAKDDFTPKCPRFGALDMQFTGGGIASMRGPWPPIA